MLDAERERPPFNFESLPEAVRKQFDDALDVLNFEAAEVLINYGMEIDEANLANLVSALHSLVEASVNCCDAYQKNGGDNRDSAVAYFRAQAKAMLGPISKDMRVLEGGSSNELGVFSDFNLHRYFESRLKLELELRRHVGKKAADLGDEETKALKKALLAVEHGEAARLLSPVRGDLDTLKNDQADLELKSYTLPEVIGDGSGLVLDDDEVDLLKRSMSGPHASSLNKGTLKDIAQKLYTQSPDTPADLSARLDPSEVEVLAEVKKALEKEVEQSSLLDADDLAPGAGAGSTTVAKIDPERKELLEKEVSEIIEAAARREKQDMSKDPGFKGWKNSLLENSRVIMGAAAGVGAGISIGSFIDRIRSKQNAALPFTPEEAEALEYVMDEVRRSKMYAASPNITYSSPEYTEALKTTKEDYLKDLESELNQLYTDVSRSVAEQAGGATTEKAASLEDVTSMDQFRSLTQEQKRAWLLMVMNKVLGGGAISSSENNTGISKYGGPLGGLLSEVISEVEGDLELGKVARHVEARIHLMDIDLVAGTGAYSLGYKSLFEGGSLSDTSARWAGLQVPSVTFRVERHLKALLSSEDEIESGVAEKLGLIIDVADSWFENSAVGGAMLKDRLDSMGPEGKNLEAKISKAFARAQGKLVSAGEIKSFRALQQYERGGLRERFFNEALQEVASEIGLDSYLDLAKQLILLLDIRGIKAEQEYAAGGSPLDSSVRKTISDSTETVNLQAKVSYGLFGKLMGGMFNPYLVLGELSKAMKNQITNEEYQANYDHQLRVANVWLDWFAPIPQDFIDELSQYDFYKGRQRDNPYPRIGEYYWYDADVRRTWMTGGEVVSFANFLETGQNFKSYIEKCMAGHRPSYSINALEKKVLEDIKDEEERRAKELEFTANGMIQDIKRAVAGISSSCSGSKSMYLTPKFVGDVPNNNHLAGADGLYAARGMYIFLRQTLLSFGQYFWDNEVDQTTYDLYVARACRAVHEAVPATLKTIFFISPNPTDNSQGGRASIATYVLNRIPRPSERNTLTPSAKVVADWTSGSPTLGDQWSSAVYYDGDRIQNNSGRLRELGEYRQSLKEKLSDLKRNLLGVGYSSAYLKPVTRKYKDKNGNPITSEQLWNSTQLPAEVVGEKAKEAKSAE